MAQPKPSSFYAALSMLRVLRTGLRPLKFVPDKLLRGARLGIHLDFTTCWIRLKIFELPAITLPVFI